MLKYRTENTTEFTMQYVNYIISLCPVYTEVIKQVVFMSIESESFIIKKVT
jgi:hypothetical protein